LLSNPPRKVPFAALAVVLLVYMTFEFHEYFEGGVKYLASLVLSLVFFGAFSTLVFGDTLSVWARRLYGDGVAFQRRAIVLFALGLATITHWHGKLKHAFYVQMRVAELPPTFLPKAVFAIFVLLCLWQLARPSVRSTPLLWIVLAWGLCLRVLGVALLPADPRAADMIFCIREASRALLAGHNPYGLTFSWGDGPLQSFPLVYFPLYWLPFAAFEAVGLDIRWLGVLAQAGLVALFLRLARDRLNDPRVLLLFTGFALVPDLIFTVVYRQTSLFWLELALFVVAVHRQLWRAAGLLVSVLVASQIPAFVILFFYLLYLWKTRGPRAAIAQGLFSVVFFLLTVAPFLGVGLARLKYAIVDYFGILTERQPWGNTLHGLSVGALAKAAGLGKVMKVVQGLAVLTVGVAYFLRKDAAFGTLLRALIFAYALFLWLSPFVFIYYWFPVIIMAALLYVLEPPELQTELAAAPPAAAASP
jgi:hypothetical protein